MTFVIGRGDDVEDRPVGTLGAYRALDGSVGAGLHFDVDGPHAMLIVGKRGYGKSYTLGVIAEELARAPGVAPVIVDPMGELDALGKGSSVPSTVIDRPRVDPATLDPRSWCDLVSLSPESGAGSLVWQAAQSAHSLDAMREHVAASHATRSTTRAAINHLDLADAWDVFDPEGLSAAEFATGEITLVDVSGLDRAPMNAVVRAIGEAVYHGRVDGDVRASPGCSSTRLTPFSTAWPNRRWRRY